MIRKPSHLREHCSKKQTHQSRRIIHVSIRTSKDYHRMINAVGDETNQLSYMTMNSNRLRTFTRNNPMSTLIKTPIISNTSKRSTVAPLQVKETWANPTDYGKKHDQNNNSKKKKKFKLDRRCLILILVALFILIAVAAILLAVLLTRPKAKTKYSGGTPVLRWNQTGITVAGISGQQGNSSDKLYKPRGLYVDWSYKLYIADTFNNRIQKYSRNTLFGETVAGQASAIAGNDPSFLYQPGNVIVDLNGNIYVSDTSNNRIQLWSFGSSTGVTLAGTTGTAGNALNQLNNPYGIVYDSIANAIYVADYINNRFPAGVTNGTVVAGGHGPGINNTQLDSPIGIYFDIESNNLLIANCLGNNVVQWTLGASGWTLIGGYLNGSSSNSSTGFSCARHVILDPMGNTYITDRSNQRVQFFPVGRTSGTTIAGITGLVGDNASLLNGPTVIALDKQLNLYVSDQNNNRIQKFLRY